MRVPVINSEIRHFIVSSLISDPASSTERVFSGLGNIFIIITVMCYSPVKFVI